MIEVKNLSKKFIVSHEKDALIRSILPTLIKPVQREELWALKDISFSLKKGESLGIVGLNGAGKSVLLNVLAGITSPTSGIVELKGRVSTLLTLGAGFNMELTGEENIYLNATILGMSLKEIREKYKSIVDFSELDGFIDAPIQTYSTGMLMRLGFSIAIHVDFDVLLIDEIIGVGDLGFSEKCTAKLKEFKVQGKNLVIASQVVDFIRDVTDKALYLKKGRLEGIGESSRITRMYEDSAKRTVKLFDKNALSESMREKKERESPYRVEPTWGKCLGNKDVEITKVAFYDKEDNEINSINTLDVLRIDISYKVNKEILDPHFGVAIFRKDKLYCYGPNTRFDNFLIDRLCQGEGTVSLYYPKLLLSPGVYCLSAAIWEKEESFPYDYHCARYKIIINGDNNRALFFQPYKSSPEFLDKDTARLKEDDISIKLADKNGKEKQVFNTEDFVKMLIETDYIENIREIIAKVYRKDKTLCFVIKEKIKSPFIKKGTVRLEVDIEELNLLAGEYYISIEIKDKNSSVLLSKDKPKEFTVFFDKKDHGIVYMPHLWSIKEKAIR
ncbi:MAG: Wzt carbohydrate-binding domain-containing protein [Candidatus Omnitrophota bacterium]